MSDIGHAGVPAVALFSCMHRRRSASFSRRGSELAQAICSSSFAGVGSDVGADVALGIDDEGGIGVGGAVGDGVGASNGGAVGSRVGVDDGVVVGGADPVSKRTEAPDRRLV